MDMQPLLNNMNNTYGTLLTKAERRWTGAVAMYDINATINIQVVMVGT